AAWLEQQGGEPVRLAGQWLAADLPLRAAPHLHRAGRAASECARLADAARWHEQAAAIELGAGDRRAAFDGYFLVADAQGELDDAASVQRCYGVMKDLADDEGQQAMLACLQVYLLIDVERRHDQARQVVLQALPKAQRAGLADIEVELLWSLAVLSHEAHRKAEALGYAELALQRLEAVDPATARLSMRDTRLTLTMAVGQLANALGRDALAQTRLSEGRRLATLARQPEQAAAAESALAANALDRGDSALALQWAASAVEQMVLGLPSPTDVGQAHNTLSVALAASGDLGRALAAAEQATQAWSCAPGRYGHGGLVHLHLLRFELGRHDLARQGLLAMAAADDLLPAQRALLVAALLSIGEAADVQAVLALALATDDVVARARLLGLAQPGVEPARILPLLAADADAALARGAIGLWLDLQTRRLAALRGSGAAAAERQALALQIWPRLDAGAIGREPFPRLAGELCLALNADAADPNAPHAALAQVIAMRASAWMLRAASTLPLTPRRIYLTQAPVLRLFGRGSLALPGV
ncbi:MAG: hypothetical protein Q8N44_11485, partial [Rubrivivax sp.]|nr:hypothetical protein [Rubrivivax sp.]